MKDKKYVIPIVSKKIEYYGVIANNLQEAVEKALKEFMAKPEEGYLEDSFEIDLEDYEGETYNIDKAIQTL